MQRLILAFHTCLCLALVAVNLGACGNAVVGGAVVMLPEVTQVLATETQISPSATLTETSTHTPTLPPTNTPTGTPMASSTPLPTDTQVPTATPQPMPTPDSEAARRELQVPILMYHYVEPWPADADQMRRGLTVRPEDFAAQMAYLRAQGYVTVSLYDLVYALALDWSLPERAVVITFDDGYRTLMDYAVPIMQGQGFTGTVFVISQLMDEGFPQYLTWDQALSLYAQGWKIEPHTKTHDQLAGRSREFQLYQMLGSMQTVEARLGTPPRFIAYPSGKYDDVTLQLVRELNLWGGLTVGYSRSQTLTTLHTLGRLRVSGTQSLAEFVHMLEGN